MQMHICILIFYILKAAMQINNLNALIKTKCMELHDFSFSRPFGRFATVIGDFFQEGKRRCSYLWKMGTVNAIFRCQQSTSIFCFLFLQDMKNSALGNAILQQRCVRPMCLQGRPAHFVVITQRLNMKCSWRDRLYFWLWNSRNRLDNMPLCN